MKKNVLILFLTLLFLVGCESTKIENKGADSFITKNDDIELLTSILQSEKVNIAFLGKTNTSKMELKEKYKKAMLDTIAKFKSL